MNIQPKWEPVSPESEQALLGAILINNEALGRVSDLVDASDFYDNIHQQIYEVARSLIEQGKLASPLTMKAFLVDFELSGGTTVSRYLARLAAAATTVVNAPDFAKIVRELADRRRIAEIALQMAPHEAADAAQTATAAIEQLDAIVTSGSSVLPAVNMDKAMAVAVDAIAKAYQGGNHLVGIPTGLKDLDHKTGGMSRGDLVVLAGRPGMGKSATLLTILRQSAKKNYRSMIASLEMSADSLGQRMISDALFDMPGENVPYSSLRTGNFHERLFQSITSAAALNQALPIMIEEQPGLTMSQIATRARRMKRKDGLDILAIDHLDLVKPSGRYMGNKVYELGEITAAAKALAKELDIVVILLCQLSREVEKREDKRPILSDLRSSGSIEQDADTVIFLYRPSYYLQNNQPKEGTPEYLTWVEAVQDANNKLLAIIAKQRMGPTGPVELFCDIANNAVRDMGVGK